MYHTAPGSEFLRGFYCPGSVDGEEETWDPSALTGYRASLHVPPGAIPIIRGLQCNDVGQVQPGNIGHRAEPDPLTTKPTGQGVVL